MNAPVAVLLLFAALGAVDEALGGKLGVAPAFRDGLAAMGPLCLSMAGIYSVAVSALSGMAGQGGGALPFDAALPAGLVLAPDMGGWAIAQALAATRSLPRMRGCWWPLPWAALSALCCPPRWARCKAMR